MKRNILMSRLSLLCLAFLLTSSVALGQSQTQGAIAGTVQDPTGAALPGALVNIHNDGTNAEKKVTADASGYFIAPLLEPGTYTLTVTAQGFATDVEKHVQVQVGQLTSVTPHLATGSETTTVDVSATAAVLNFESPDLSTVIDQKALVNIPENNRRWSSLAMTTPGVVSDSNGFGLVAVRGISPLLNNVEIDGADDNQAFFSEERGRTREAYSTSQDAVREFAVNTGVYSAEYGRAAGAVINSVTKSGTNDIHGEAYFYDRESNWSAYTPLVTNTVQNASGQFVNVPLKPKDLRKIYGFSAGGPLIKDRLFWYYTFDQHAHLFPGIAKPSNPGTFFSQPDATLPGAATCNLTTGLFSANGASSAANDPSACTLAARTNQASYAAGASLYNTDLTGLLADLGTVPRTGYQEINTPKLDWQITPKERVSFLYHRLRWDSPGGVQTQSTATYATDTFGNDFVKLDYGVAKLDSQITTTISNELGYQYGRELDDETQQKLNSYSQSNFVGTGNSAGNVPFVELAATGTTTCSGVTSGYCAGSPYYSYRSSYPDERKWQVFDTAYWAHGNHSVKFGADVLHNADLLNNLFVSNGVYTYQYIGNYFADLYAKQNNTTSNCNSAASQAASATVSAVGTYPCYTDFTEGYGLTPEFAISTADYGFFAQDNWKLTPRLTLELGVRYDYESVPSPTASLGAPLKVVNPGGTTLYSYNAPAGLSNRPSDKNNIGPRIGFAYDVFGNGQTVLRGGYGMYYGRILNGVIENVYLSTGSALGQYTATITNTQGGPTFPNILSNVTSGSSGTVTQSVGSFATPSAYFFAKNFQNPMVNEFDMILQQQIGSKAVISVSYLGSLGRDLPNYINVNLNPTTQQTVTMTVAPYTAGSSNCGPLVCGSKYQVAEYVKATPPSPTFYSAFNNPNFVSITEAISNITSSYNALVGEIKTKNYHGLETSFNYTWSHALDYNQNAQTQGTTNSWYDPYGNARANYGNSNYNVPNRIVGYVIYSLPKLEGHNWATWFANGWNISNDFQAQNGLPYSYGTSGSNAYYAASSGWNGSGGISYVPILGRNTLQQKRAIVDDVRLAKGFAFTERYNLELRGDFFNIANHQNVTSLNTTAYSFSNNGSSNPLTGTATYQQPTFGTITSVNSSGFTFTPREIQLSARFQF